MNRAGNLGVLVSACLEAFSFTSYPSGLKTSTGTVDGRVLKTEHKLLKTMIITL